MYEPMVEAILGHSSLGRESEYLEQDQHYSAHLSSTLNSSTRGASDMNSTFTSLSGLDGTSNVWRTYRLPADSSVHVEDETVRWGLSPHLDEDVSGMHREPSYLENENFGYHLNIPSEQYMEDIILDPTSPWNALPTRQPYTNTRINEFTRYQESFLNAPGTEQVAAASFPEIQENAEELRPRGGRQPGTRLSPHLMNNVREVRRSGACLRCSTLRERCSGGTPCVTCNQNDGRKWSGCVRNISELTDVLRPEILANRLRPQALRDFMARNTNIFEEPSFDLPIKFGFGRTFYGFRGAEYDPATMDAYFSHFIGPTDLRLESGIRVYSLPVLPINSDSIDVQRKVFHWLKDTLTSPNGMEDWMQASFPGEGVEWIRNLLHLTWRYSMTYWDGSRSTNNQVDEPQLGGNLLTAWTMAMLVTMLSLPVTIPPCTQQEILSRLRFMRDEYSYSYSSRPLNKCVKGLLLSMYEQLVERVMSILKEFKKLKTAHISERYWGHMRCITILIVIVTSQLQTSLMDNSRLPPQGNQNLWAETCDNLQKVEGAFKNLILFTRLRCNAWAKKLRPRQHGNHDSDDDDEDYDDSQIVVDPRLQEFLRDIREIRIDYSGEINSHKSVKFESLIEQSLPFHTANMQRAFAFYFAAPSKGRQRGGR